MKTAPHYLLLTNTEQSDQFKHEDRATTAAGHSIAPTTPAGGRWHFVLEPIHNGVRIEADDIEPGVFGERLNLLAVVRGLEALDQPSQVTLITPSKIVGRGIRRDVRIWKENDWQWDRFGQRVDIKHRDLWQRIDRAMQFHRLDCRIFGSGQSQTQQIARSSVKLKNKSLVHDHSNPYSTPFANNTSNANASATSATSDRHRQRIVLTTERMNDEFLALDDLPALEARHQKLFKATKTGWTRVTEIDADAPMESEHTAAFGCSVN